jgi:dipeptidyl aminopeptidase/acylaminoacyl peptidase
VIQEGVPAPTIRYITRLRYKMDGVGWVENRFRQLWSIDVESGELVQLTADERDYSQPRWSWGGTQLAYTVATREMDIPQGHGQIEIMDFATRSTRMMLPGWNGLAHSPQWRADDNAIVFTGHNSPPPVNNRIFSHVWHHDLTNGVSRDLSEDHDAEVGNYCVADQRAALTNITVRWPGGKGKIWFLLTEQGACHLYSTTEEGGCHFEVGGKSVTFEYAPSVAGSVVYGQADWSNPGDLYLLKDGVTTCLTDLNPWLRTRQLSQPCDYWYDGVEGARVHAWEMKPLDFDASKRYPLVLEVHCSQFSWDFSFEFHCLTAGGYVVAYFNQRGTTAGYGQAWTRASEGDQGGKDYDEIMLGVDDLLTRTYIDGQRMGVTGGSCGGFLTNWIVGHTDRFKAAVTQRSVVNEISMFGTSDIGPEMSAGETSSVPWTGLETMWRQSPIAYVENIHTPLLILHATEDHRCALEQAEQLYAALRWLKRPVEMVIFVGESHGLTRGGRPGNRIEHLKRIKGWFDRYLTVQ